MSCQALPAAGRDSKVSIYWENRRNNIKTSLPPTHSSPNWYQHPGSASFPEVCQNSSQLRAADPELTPRCVGLVFSSSRRGFVLGSLRDEVPHTSSSLSTQLPNYLELPELAGHWRFPSGRMHPSHPTFLLKPAREHWEDTRDPIAKKIQAGS